MNSEILSHLPASFRVLAEFAMNKEEKATGAGEAPAATSAHLRGGALSAISPATS